MEKFKVRFSYQDMVLEVEGAREDIPVITQTLGERFKSLVGTSFSGSSATEQNAIEIGSPMIPAKSKIVAPEKTGKRPGRKKGTKLIEIDGKKIVVDASELRTEAESKKSKESNSNKSTSKTETAVVPTPSKEKVSKKAKANQVSDQIAETKPAKIKSQPEQTSNPVAPEPQVQNVEVVKEPLILNWEKHDRTKYGLPESEWEKSDMMLWFLYVAPKYTSFATLSLKQIVASVNNNFKPTRRLREETAFKELNAYKRGKQIFVKEGPISRYSITEAGAQYVRDLIAQKIEAANEAEVW